MFKSFIPGLLAAAAAAPLAAQRLEPRPVPNRGVESFTFDSPSMGVRFAVNVGLPPKYEPGRKYGALVVTDGDWAFPGVYDGTYSMMEQGFIDGLLVVSIGVAFADGDSLWTRRRIYEFSPPNWDRKDPFGRLVEQFCVTYRMAPGKCTGGAPAFLNAIATELIPLIAARYPIDTNNLGLFGVSAGGFFASWTIFQPNTPFTRYIISSPAMAYGDGVVFRLEEQYAAEHRDLKAGIYVASGGLEATDPFFEGIGRIVSGSAHLAGVLGGRKYPSLKLTHELHPGMSHGDVMGTTVVRGLRVLYGK